MLTNEEKRLIEVVEQAPQTTPYSWTVQTIKALIKNEVEKYVISKCSEELESGELLIVNVEIGEMPKEVRAICHYGKCAYLCGVNLT